MADAMSQVTQRRQIDAKNTSTSSLTGDTLLPGAEGAVHAPCLSICSQRRMSRSIKGACYIVPQGAVESRHAVHSSSANYAF